MLKRTAEWELVNPVWSDDCNPELIENETNLKIELRALHRFVEQRALSRALLCSVNLSDWINALKIIVEKGTLRFEGDDDVEVIDFSTVKKLFDNWEYARQRCEHYKRQHDCSDFPAKQELRPFMVIAKEIEI